ncbi:MAG: serine/threonine protein kinase with repeat, partial [Myxococcales bacterium]|nr:serine/threonine protein kinase with repeat [Myxococcales bacterium]
MGTSETLRSVLEAGSTSKRLDELSTARVIGQTALKVHAEQQKAGPGKAVGPITPGAVGIGKSGDISLALGKQESALGYSAPESLGGASDRRSDVFSLGVLMWEALTHQRLFEAMNDAAVKAAIKERDITPPAELNANIPAELSAICMKALARNPADRYQSTKVMAVEIEEMLSEAGYPDNDERVAAYIA